MSEDYEFSEDPNMMRMEEDGEANSDDPMSATTGECGLMGGEAEGSKIDASKNEEDEGYVVWTEPCTRNRYRTGPWTDICGGRGDPQLNNIYLGENAT